MQSPEAFESLPSLTATLARSVQPDLAPERAPADLKGLFRFLDEWNKHLESDGRRVVLALDEYEQIDAKIGARIFPVELLDTLRESIQSHRAITWLLAGSHEITELPNAPWTSYLVSARLIEVPPFTLAETRLLLTEPLRRSPLFQDDSKRPRFPEPFWGEGGIERIHRETGGWPHLVQLLAETFIDILNDEGAHSVTPGDFQRACERAIVRGHTVFYQLLRGESTLPGEWEYLEGFRGIGYQPPPADLRVARSLKHRELVLEENGTWRFACP